MVYNIEPMKQFDHRLPTYADCTPKPKIKTPRVVRPGYYNGLERDLYGWHTLPMRPPQTAPATARTLGYRRPYEGNTKLSPYGMSDYDYTPYDFRPVTSHIRD